MLKRQGDRQKPEIGKKEVIPSKEGRLITFLLFLRVVLRNQPKHSGIEEDNEAVADLRHRRPNLSEDFPMWKITTEVAP